jgi:hypothetical protein
MERRPSNPPPTSFLSRSAPTRHTNSILGSRSLRSSRCPGATSAILRTAALRERSPPFRASRLPALLRTVFRLSLAGAPSGRAFRSVLLPPASQIGSTPVFLASGAYRHPRSPFSRDPVRRAVTACALPGLPCLRPVLAVAPLRHLSSRAFLTWVAFLSSGALSASQAFLPSVAF